MTNGADDGNERAPGPSAPLVAGVVVAVLLSLRAPADVGPRDAGELSAAAWVLGVSHPTGSPFCMTLQSLAARLPLFGIALRQGLLMAVCTGVAVGLAAHVAGRGRGTNARWLAAAVVALAASAPTLLRAGTMTEVYAPSLCLVAAAWSACHLRTARGLFLLGALTALGASAHVTARILVPLCALPALVEVSRSRGLRRALTPFGSGLLVFVPLLLHVPVAASRTPPLAWGDPRTPLAFFRHFMASDARATFSERTSGGFVLADLRALVDTTLLDLGVPVLLLGVAFGLLLFRRGKPELSALRVVAATGGVDLAYSLVVHPMGIWDRQVGHAALLSLATLAAALVAELSELRGRLVGWLLLAGAAAGPVLRVRNELSGEDGRLVAELWTVPGALARAPSGAIVVCDGDDACGGALYAQLVEGARPDVGVLPRPYASHPELISSRLPAIALALESGLRNRDRPILVQGGGEVAYPFPTALDAAVPLLRASLGGAPDVGPRVPFVERLEALDRRLCGEELAGCPPLTRSLLAQAHLGPLGPAIRDRRLAEAERLSTLGLRLDPRSAALWNNRGVVRATGGRLEEALEDAKRALELDPARQAAASNVITWSTQLGRVAEAKQALHDLARRCAGCLSARILGAALDAREGGPSARDALDALSAEASRKGKHDAWCRAYLLASLPPPDTCR